MGEWEVEAEAQEQRGRGGGEAGAGLGWSRTTKPATEMRWSWCMLCFRSVGEPTSDTVSASIICSREPFFAVAHETWHADAISCHACCSRQPHTQLIPSCSGGTMRHAPGLGKRCRDGLGSSRGSNEHQFRA